jgi:hypothetical protein
MSKPAPATSGSLIPPKAPYIGFLSAAQHLASLAVLSARVAARAEGITEGEYLDRIVRLWTDSPK